MLDTADMKALKAIHILTTCGSVTKTAEIMNVSPGTISYLLNKVRKSTGSVLFFRTRKGMIPDNTAQELSKRYEAITQKLLDENGGVSLTNRDVAFSAYSLVEFLISLSLADKERFPYRLKFLTPELHDDLRLVRLRNKVIDVDIGTRLPVDKSIIQVAFFNCDVSVVVSENHPTIKDAFTMQDWLDNEHIIWSRGMDLFCDDFEHANRFDTLIHQRKIAVESSNSLNMITLCAYSDKVMFFPTVIIKHIKNRLPIKVFEPPAELKMRFECFLHYHHSLANDHAMKDILSSLRALIKESAATEP